MPRILAINMLGIFLLSVSPLAKGQILDSPRDQGPRDQGSSNRGTIRQTPVSPASSPASSTDVQQTSWWTLPMPKITMPKLTMPQITMPQITSFWPSYDGQTSDKPSPFAPLVTGGRKISDGTKKAWAGAKEMLSFTGANKTAQTPRVATRKQPSIWKRMFTPSPPEPDGPRTVAEWMKQPRLDP